VSSKLISFPELDLFTNWHPRGEYISSTQHNYSTGLSFPGRWSKGTREYVMELLSYIYVAILPSCYISTKSLHVRRTHKKLKYYAMVQRSLVFFDILKQWSHLNSKEYEFKNSIISGQWHYFHIIDLCNGETISLFWAHKNRKHALQAKCTHRFIVFSALVHCVTC
jgi:hypothetical protein